MKKEEILKEFKKELLIKIKEEFWDERGDNDDNSLLITYKQLKDFLSPK